MPTLINIGYLAICKDEGAQAEIHPIKDAAIAWEGNEIRWVGKEQDMPEEYAGKEVVNANGQMVVPGLVDCHTHLAFGGWRPHEFAMRVQGKSYLEIAKAGGGILSTVEATRNRSEQQLYAKASRLLDDIMALGVTTIECKSGYGLNVKDELKILRVYKKLAEENPIHVVPTFLGAHTFPPEYKDARQEYIDLVINEMIPAVVDENLAEFCDIFVEESAFSVEEARRILVSAQAAGLTPKLHADQLTGCGGAELAAELEAASADHLEQISDAGIEAMAEAGVVGVTLPLASLYTQEPPLNCRRLIEGGVRVAVATDFNPGSAPSYDLPLAMMLACNQGRITPAEALKGATIYAAKAINKDGKTGSLQPGKAADFIIVDSPNPEFWMYHFRPNQLVARYQNGERTH